MEPFDYKETELWRQAKALLIETYRVTQGWPEQGKDLAADFRSLSRQIVRVVPNAFKKGGITGNMHLQVSRGQFAELEALCEAAELLEFVGPNTFQPLIEIMSPMEAKFRELTKASRERAQELMRKRASLFPRGLDDDDEE